MTKKALSVEEIKMLRQAIKNKGIVYEELEEKVLNVVSNDTARLMELDQLSFYEASKEAFQRLGPNGLKVIQRNFERSLKKRSLKYFYGLAKAYFKGNKACLTGIFLMLSMLGPIMLPEWHFNIFGVIWFGLFLFVIGSYFWIQLKVTKASHRSLHHYIFSGIHGFNMVILLLIIFLPKELIAGESILLGIMTFLVLVLHMIYFESLFHLMKQSLGIDPQSSLPAE